MSLSEGACPSCGGALGPGRCSAERCSIMSAREQQLVELAEQVLALEAADVLRAYAAERESGRASMHCDGECDAETVHVQAWACCTCEAHRYPYGPPSRDCTGPKVDELADGPAACEAEPDRSAGQLETGEREFDAWWNSDGGSPGDYASAKAGWLEGRRQLVEHVAGGKYGAATGPAHPVADALARELELERQPAPWEITMEEALAEVSDDPAEWLHADRPRDGDL